MKKICVFCEKWGSGGIETFLISTFRKIDRKRFDIHLVAALLESEVYLPQLKELDIELEILEKNGVSSHMSFSAFYKAICGCGYDVAHFNLYEGLSLGYVEAAKRAKIPIRIVHSHNTDLHRSLLRPVKLFIHNLSKILYKDAATERLACSGKAAEFLFTRDIIAQKRWTFVPNSVDIERFEFDPVGRERMRRELGLRNDYAVGCIGRLCAQKNQMFILRVFKKAMLYRPDLRLFLVGEGEDENSLRALAAKLGIENQVVFLGVSDHVPELMWAFDVLAFPSLFEGLGIVAVEAQIAGLPVVISENVPNEVKITELANVVPLDDEDAWAQKLISFSGISRKGERKAVCDAGYSADKTALLIENMWEAKI